MTPDAMAALYAAGFPEARPWSAAELTALLARDDMHAVIHPQGFAILCLLVPEAEIVTLVVDPGARREGHGRALVGAVCAKARAGGADRLFLEVAADNAPAIALYHGCGFVRTGRRAGYYTRQNGMRIDALLLERALDAPTTGTVSPELS